MSWLGLLQGTKVGAPVRAVGGGSCGSVKGAGGTGCFQEHTGGQMLHGVFWAGGCTQGVFLARTDGCSPWCWWQCLTVPSLPAGAATAATPINPFQVNQPQPLTLNQMRASPVMGSSPSFSTVPPLSMEPIPLSSMAPVPVGMAPLPAMGTIRMGQGLSIAGSMPQALHSTGMPPAASQAANTTNPFLL